MHKQERFTASFQRSVRLPASVSTEEEAKATYRNGVLEIRMPKLNDEQGNKKKIDVKFQ
ncbi:Hsp20/alpha crystallin family protein [Bacillus sp. T33-2]|uniref:Hsp20/alpha crystallin family protein n=1 Tax=Bacillus sp. T33-2 TaxID=2054168 RepID=UPI0035B56A39